MLILGIESTAHTFAVSVVRKIGTSECEGWTFLSNVRKPFVTKEGGLIPAKVSDHHVEVCGTVLKESLEQAKISLDDIDLVAFSQGPGIGNMLRIGVVMARSIALQHNKPLVGVNHCVAHLEIGRVLSRFKDPLMLYVSGANTQVIAYDTGKFRVLGETLDVGVGNFLDMLGRELNLGFPGGPQIEQLAKNGKYHPLPYVVKGMDISLAGLHTRLKKDIALGKSHEDLSYSVQETVFAMLCEVAERALAHTGKNELVLGGGVACNARLQEMVNLMARDRGAKSFAPAKEYLVDNAAMIAVTGALMHSRGATTQIDDSVMLPHQRTDEVIVSWR